MYVYVYAIQWLRLLAVQMGRGCRQAWLCRLPPFLHTHSKRSRALSLAATACHASRTLLYMCCYICVLCSTPMYVSADLCEFCVCILLLILERVADACA